MDPSKRNLLRLVVHRSAIASQLFTRVGSLDQRQQDQFMEQIQRDPQAKRVFEKMQTYSR